MPLRAGETGKCLHCGTGVRFESVQVNSAGNVTDLYISTPSDTKMLVRVFACPHCGMPTLVHYSERKDQFQKFVTEMPLYPDKIYRPIPKEVVAESPALAADFGEAVAVFARSKKASAALSRRCLQFILVNKGGAKKKDLADQIVEVLPSLPEQLALNVDAIRTVGNFAAHPMKSKASGEIVEVEEGEAEWLLEVLEELFEHYYIAPARAIERRAAVNAKLADLGKPPLKTP